MCEYKNYEVYDVYEERAKSAKTGITKAFNYYATKDVAVRIFNMYHDGLSYKKISNILNEEKELALEIEKQKAEFNDSN